MTSATSIYELLTQLQEKVFSIIQHEQEGEMTEDQFDEKAGVTNINLATDTIRLCQWSKKFVEEFGVFYALQIYNLNGNDDIDYADRWAEKRFYTALLYVIITASDEAVRSLSYEAYQTYCAKNPLD